MFHGSHRRGFALLTPLGYSDKDKPPREVGLTPGSGISADRNASLLPTRPQSNFEAFDVPSSRLVIAKAWPPCALSSLILTSPLLTTSSRLLFTIEDSYDPRLYSTI